MTTRRISGWARLWIVATLAIWGAGIAAGLLHRPEGIAQVRIRERLPPFALSRSDLCHEWHGIAEAELCSNPDGPSRLYRELLRTHAVDNQWRSVAGYWTPFWAWAVAPFALGLLMVGIGWTRRGFREQSN